MVRVSLSGLPWPMNNLHCLLFLVTPGFSLIGNELLSCDFENDLCGLTQGTDDDFDWTRRQRPAATGPSEAYQGGHCIYAEANNHNGKVADLRTPNLNYQGVVCVTFAYHMHGQVWDNLQLSVSPDGDNIVTIKSDQGNQWIEWARRVTLNKGEGIRFRAYIAYADTSDIAVDDLVIREGSCKDIVPLPYSCSFESGLCGMTQRLNDHFDWMRHNRSTGSPYTGPRKASDGEWFIYIEAYTSGLYNGHTAYIETPAFNHTGTLCLRFNYHMYGAQNAHIFSVGTLIALHEAGTTTTGESRVFEKTGHQGNLWLSAAVDVIGFQPGDWITFRATRGDSNFGDIAVDNINIATGGCRDCHTSNGNCQHICVPESTGDRCACHHGYRLEGDTMCTDIDECLEQTAGCSQHCNNTDGGFTCHCHDGFLLGLDNSTCQDIDECFEKIAGCSQLCDNTDGSFTCHCNDGFRMDKDNSTCQDIDECSENTAGCSQLCNNTDGGFTCHCDDGFMLDNKITCQDIDECAENTAGCSQLCHNTVGGFTCHCDDGFRMDKDNSTCQDTDECFENTAGCSQHCINAVGGFTCYCDDGFILDKDKATCQVPNLLETDKFNYGNHNTVAAQCKDFNNVKVTLEKTSLAIITWFTKNYIKTKPKGGASVAIIAGAAVAAAVVVTMVIIIFVLFILRRRRQMTNREVEAYAYVNVGRSRDLEMDTVDKDSSMKPASDKDPSLEVRPSQMYATVIPKAQRPQKADTHDKDRPASSTAKPEIADSILSEENAGKTDGSSYESGDAESVTEEETDKGGSISEIPSQCAELNEEQHDDTAIEHAGLYYNLPPTATIQTSIFPAHVKKLQKNKGFEKEYKRLPSGKLSDWEAATRQDLKAKNRFKNIYPYDSNRVHMNTIPGDPNSDYINASHIQGFSENDRFIASHGPTPLTKHDFWRMIWEQDVTVVVMVTNLLEDGTVRCVKYWPDKEEVMTYDDITVTLTKEEKLPDFTMRVCKLTKAGEEERVVEQCHYTSWPDHGVPEDATSILKFHKRVRQRMKPGKPTVVHCSAGVGRTGTFIAIDYLLNQAEETQSLDVYGCVSRLRHQRIQMVQAQSQYEFIHTTLVEALVIGDTTISCDSYHDKIKDMKHVIQDQFQYLEELKSAYSKEDIELANNEKNKAKNTKAHIIPRGTTRVFLTSQEHDRNDYINAVFVHSYHKRNAYIATQLPLSDTTIDFWRMIHDLRCDTIVLIGHSMAELFNGEDGMEHEIGKYHVTTTCPVGSPLGEDLQQTTVTVDKAFLPPTYANAEMMAQEDDDKAADNIYRVSCRVIVVPSPSAGYLSSAILTRMFAVVKDGERSNETFTVFVCGDGAALSGVAIACFSLFEMMPIEDAVDVFHVVKQIKDSRPEFISTLDQYSHLYDVAGEYIKQYGTYSNFR